MLTTAVEIKAFAPAKINLYLHVTAKRDDGYHLLDSLIAFADIGDDLTVEAAETLSLTIDGPFGAGLPADDNNLALRAARGLQQLLGVKAGARLHLMKNLPLASGIGGGSADAAAALRALQQAWQGAALRPLKEEALHALALSLGADVPVCLASRTAYFGGIGDVIDLVPSLPPTYLVLVNPLIPVPTAQIFKARTGPYTMPARLKDWPKDAETLAAFLRDRRNDLEEPACHLAPEIRQVLAAIADSGACLLARMSGSGATCFGLYAQEKAAREAATAIAQHFPQWWVRPGRLLS